MKIPVKTVIFWVMFLFAAPAVFAQMDQNSEEPNVPAGMELIKVGETKILVPQGTKLYRKDALLILEPPEQYWTRRIAGMEEEISKLRAEEEGMKADIEELKNTLNLTENGPKK